MLYSSFVAHAIVVFLVLFTPLVKGNRLEDEIAHIMSNSDNGANIAVNICAQTDPSQMPGRHLLHKFKHAGDIALEHLPKKFETEINAFYQSNKQVLDSQWETLTEEIPHLKQHGVRKQYLVSKAFLFSATMSANDDVKLCLNLFALFTHDEIATVPNGLIVTSDTTAAAEGTKKKKTKKKTPTAQPTPEFDGTG